MLTLATVGGVVGADVPEYFGRTIQGEIFEFLHRVSSNQMILVFSSN